MATKPYRKLQRWIKRKIKKYPVVAVALAVVLFGVLVYAIHMQNKRLEADPSTFIPLLNLIAQVESKGNYSAYFGNPHNTDLKFTEMPIREVINWQRAHVQQGNISNAVGRYQIIDTTLTGLVEELGIDPSRPFNQTTQDTLASALIKRRGADAYVNKEITREQFAANLAKEWAALPKVLGENPNDSYYASDGINRSLVDVKEVLKAIEPIASK